MIPKTLRERMALGAPRASVDRPFSWREAIDEAFAEVPELVALIEAAVAWGETDTNMDIWESEVVVRRLAQAASNFARAVRS